MPLIFAIMLLEFVYFCVLLSGPFQSVDVWWEASMVYEFKANNSWFSVASVHFVVSLASDTQHITNLASNTTNYFSLHLYFSLRITFLLQCLSPSYFKCFRKRKELRRKFVFSSSNGNTNTLTHYCSMEREKIHIDSISYPSTSKIFAILLHIWIW